MGYNWTSTVSYRKFSLGNQNNDLNVTSDFIASYDIVSPIAASGLPSNCNVISPAIFSMVLDAPPPWKGSLVSPEISPPPPSLSPSRHSFDFENLRGHECFLSNDHDSLDFSTTFPFLLSGKSDPSHEYRFPPKVSRRQSNLFPLASRVAEVRRRRFSLPEWRRTSKILWKSAEFVGDWISFVSMDFALAVSAHA